MRYTWIALLWVLGTLAFGARSGATPAPADGSSYRASFDDDDDEEEWKCTCSVSCDGTKISVSERVCADDERLQEAIDDAVAACRRDADARCDDEPTCKCTCKATGRDC